MKTTNRKKTIFTVLMVVFLVSGLLLAGCSDKKATAEPKKASTLSATEKLPKMVDFWSPTCPPCRQMMPFLAELHEEYSESFELVKIDVSKAENREAAIQNQIQYIPTQIFYDANGKQLYRHTGFFSKQQILDKWEELGYDMKAKE